MRTRSAAGGALAWYLLAAWLGGATEAADAGTTVGGTMQAREPASSAPAHTNRLRDCTSPYLLQHQHHPVDWYPWGPAALARAKAEDKPIFLSIGYAACHWCHVMAHESFEDAPTAETLNKLFINIKVDREERPDLDEIYMQATLVLNQGNGGWPMSVWLTPDLKPFFAGTYFPPERRHGRPGFRELCEMIGKTWRERRTELLQHADELTGAVQRMLRAAPADGTELSLALVDETAEQLASAFDKTSGGLTGGGTNKFPPSMALDLLLRSAHRRATESARRKQFLELVELTLDHMAAGGIYDQLGGGIHRYSTDVEWHVPHFEKMLYDQALVARTYLDAFQVTGKADYAHVARDICDYVLADLRCPSGAFFSSRDADSEGVEGKFYVWTKAQVLDVLGNDCGEKFCAVYDISESGNWADPHDPDARKSIPRRLRDEETCARMFNISGAEFRRKLANCREKLVAVRSQRVAPALDDKVLCEWNGLMIASLARVGTVLNEPRYVQAAAAAAHSILARQYRDGRLRRAYRAGQTTETAFLSDYASMIEACLELYEATFERAWLAQALTLQHTALKLFWDETDGGFYFTPADHEQLIARSKDVRDNAVPSGNSVMLLNLLRLASLTGEAEFKARATRHMAALAGDVQRSPWSSERFLAGVDFAYAQPVEIAIVGDPAQPATQALLRVVHETYLPNRVLMLHNPQRPEDSFDAPLLAHRGLVDGRPAAYVCRNFVCQRPVTTPAELRAQLAR